MRKSLLGFVLLAGVGIGVFPLADALAATLPASNLSGTPPNTVYSGVSVASPANASGVSGGAIVQYAMKFLGYPYTATGDSPSTGFSCIGFVSYVYRSLGINMPGDLGSAYGFAPQVAFSDLQPGDVLFFQNTVWNGLSHAAIYIGGGRFIHAEWYNRGVVISSFTNDPVDDNYWQAHYLGAIRPWSAVAGPASAAPVVQPTPTPVPVAPRRLIPSSQSQAGKTAPATGRLAIPAGPVRRRPSGPTALVRVPGLNVRSRPSHSATIATVVSQGTRLILLGQRYGWYRVALAGRSIGWVIGAGIGRGTAVTRAPYRLRGGLRAGNRNLASVRRSSVRARLQTVGTVTVQANGVRVHGAPSLVGAVLGSVGRGQRLGVVRRLNGWVEVRLAGGGAGWISDQFVEAPSPYRAVRVRTQLRRAASQQSAASRESRARVAINVRAGASLSSAIISVLAPGGSYQVLWWSNGWARVRLSNGTVGWMSGTILGAAGATARPTRQQTARVKASIQAGTGSVARAALNVRQRPSLSASIVSVLAPGGTYQVLGWSAGWARVRLADGAMGWISGSVLGTTSSAASTARNTTSSSASTQPVVTAGVRLHSGPGLSQPTIGLVAAGTHVQVLGSSVGWMKVRLPTNRTGYILGTYVKQ